MAIHDNHRPDPADLAALGMNEAAFNAEVDEARLRADIETPDETRVVAVRYDSPTGRIVIDLANETTLLIPAHRLQALSKAAPDDLAHVAILGTHMLEWPSIDQQVYIPDLLHGITGSRTWMAAQMGRKGGSSKSTSKAEAARENGKKGGRPKKSQPA
jgi:hypothetical protein